MILAMTRMGVDEKCIKYLVRKPESKKPVRRHRHGG
jgi:hypothetical protein